MRYGCLLVVLSLLTAVPTSAQVGTLRVAERQVNQARSPWSRWLSNGQAAHVLSGRFTSEQRLKAARQLSLRGDPGRATTTLAENLLVERQPAVRAEIAKSLLRLARPEALDALESASEIGGSRESETLALALGEIAKTQRGKAQTRALKILTKMMSRRMVAAYASKGLVRAGAVAIPGLQAMVRDGQNTLAAISILGELRARSSVKQLIPLTSHSTAVVRITALSALAKIGDPRAAPAAAQALESSERGVVFEALKTLAVVGNETYTDFLRRVVKDDAAELREQALRTWLELDPLDAQETLATMLASDDQSDADLAARLALEAPSKATAALLYGILQEGSRIDAAASTIANLPNGLGTAILLEEAARLAKAKKDARPVLRALAVSARQHAPNASQRRAIRRAFSVLAPNDQMLFSALCKDSTTRSGLEKLLTSEDSEDRLMALWGLSYLPPGSGPALTSMLERVKDKAEFRLLVHTAVTHNLALESSSLALLSKFVADEDTKASALLWSAVSLKNADPQASKHLRGELRSMLRDRSAYHGAVAAWALTLADDRAAARALLAATTDIHPDVRRAAARALSVLLRHRSPHARLSGLKEALVRNARAEQDEGVRQMLWDAAYANTRRPSSTFEKRGNQTLQFAVAEKTVVGLDVVLEDGRWMRLSNLPSGEMFIPDLLRGSQANVDVRVSLD